MRWHRPPPEIDLRGALPDERMEVIELPAASPGPAPRPFAELDDLPEPAYATSGHDPTGTVGIWRALESL